MYRFLLTFALLVPSIHATLHIKLDMSGPVLNYSIQGNAGGTSSFQWYGLWATNPGSNIQEYSPSGNINTHGSLNAPPDPSTGYQWPFLDLARVEYYGHVNGFGIPNWVTFNVAGLGSLSSITRITHVDSSGQFLYSTTIYPYLPGNLGIGFYVPADRTAPGFDAYTQGLLSNSNFIVAGGNQVLHANWADGGHAIVEFTTTPEPISILLLASAMAGSLIAARRFRRKEKNIKGSSGPI